MSLKLKSWELKTFIIFLVCRESDGSDVKAMLGGTTTGFARNLTGFTAQEAVSVTN